MKEMILGMLEIGKTMRHAVDPTQTDAFWTNPATGQPFFGKCVPTHQYTEQWEMLEIGYDQESDLTVRILLADWPGIPTVGEKFFVLNKTYRVDGRTISTDGTEYLLLLREGE